MYIIICVLYWANTVPAVHQKQWYEKRWEEPLYPGSEFWSQQTLDLVRQLRRWHYLFWQRRWSRPCQSAAVRQLDLLFPSVPHWRPPCCIISPPETSSHQGNHHRLSLTLRFRAEGGLCNASSGSHEYLMRQKEGVKEDAWLDPPGGGAGLRVGVWPQASFKQRGWH